ncbi:hypothetical protein HDV02_005884 [Globomyces sp. JEL0801]|nr:hypothetical protein HDV02_005884 [Globomyces sp. JEL0801]
MTRERIAYITPACVFIGMAIHEYCAALFILLTVKSRDGALYVANESSDSVGSRVYIGELTIGSAFRGIILFANLKNLDANVWVSSILESIGSFGVDFKIYHNTDLNGQDEMEEAQLIMNMLKGGLL